MSCHAPLTAKRTIQIGAVTIHATAHHQGGGIGSNRASAAGALIMPRVYTRRPDGE